MTEAEKLHAAANAALRELYNLEARNVQLIKTIADLRGELSAAQAKNKEAHDEYARLRIAWLEAKKTSIERYAKCERYDALGGEETTFKAEAEYWFEVATGELHLHGMVSEKLVEAQKEIKRLKDLIEEYR